MGTDRRGRCSPVDRGGVYCRGPADVGRSSRMAAGRGGGRRGDRPASGGPEPGFALRLFQRGRGRVAGGGGLSAAVPRRWPRRVWASSGAGEWNLAFSEMTAVAVYRPLSAPLGRGTATLGAFLFSGVLHELAISLPVLAGFGLPSLYFALHGLLVLVKRTARKGGAPGQRTTRGWAGSGRWPGWRCLCRSSSTRRFRQAWPGR